jgi:uncharacterized protein YjbJ (UPF0337 family)
MLRLGFERLAAWHTGNPYPDRQEPIMGLKDDVTGKAKEAEGKLTDDKSREAEGKLDQAKGKAKDALEDAKDATGSMIDRAREEITERRSAADAPESDPRAGQPPGQTR